MVGVWDTVGALGIPVGSFNNFSTSSFTWMHTGLRTPIENAFHAIAVDEFRKKFAPTLWTIKNTTNNQRSIVNIEQRWFPGAHSNVGGGYFNDTLAQRPLRWMIEKAAGLGLCFRRIPAQLDDIHTAVIADSYGDFLKGFYSLLFPPYNRPVGEKERMVDGVTSSNLFETIDRSVFERMQQNSAYRPKNIMEWASSRDVDWKSSAGSLDAVSGKKINCSF